MSYKEHISDITEHLTDQALVRHAAVYHSVMQSTDLQLPIWKMNQK